jgi:hypothetical protein
VTVRDEFPKHVFMPESGDVQPERPAARLS